jgi:hypothetical protein
MARDAENFFMCFLAIWTSSFEKALFRRAEQVLSGGLVPVGMGRMWGKSVEG